MEPGVVHDKELLGRDGLRKRELFLAPAADRVDKRVGTPLRNANG